MKKCLKIIAVILALICLTGCSNLNVKDWLVKKQAINYLCEKYNAEPDEFEVVNYEAKHIYWQEYQIFFLKPVKIECSFVVVYNDRHFVVSRNDKGFYDDYQLEDIELWGTEWLQENVDERIVGFKIWTDNILEYYKNTDKDYSYVITNTDTEEFLKNYESDDIVETFYLYDANIEDYQDDDELANKIKSSLSLKGNCDAGYYNKPLCRKMNTLPSDEWSSVYTFIE